MQPDGLPKTHHDLSRTRLRRRASLSVRRGVSLGVGFVFLAWCLGCERSSLTDGMPDTLDCSSCHGNAGNPAPPKAVNGSSSTTDIGVGAHAAHLAGNNIAGPIACVECHPMPTNLLTHPALDPRPANVVFGSLSTHDGALPTWERTSVTCRNTYCHGSTLSGAETRLSPIWTKVDGSQRSCFSCHGFPPAGDHPASILCETCHGDVAGPGGTIKTPARHVDGVLDFGTATSRVQRGKGFVRYALHGRQSETDEGSSLW
jgi:predicted CxxxxCH...CXXCH cytochrome family protein